MVWGERLVLEEVNFCSNLIQQFSEEAWLQPIIRSCGDPSTWVYDVKPRLFELRYGAALADRGVKPEYEVPGGVHETTIDFRFVSGGITWLVELVSILTSDAVKDATIADGPLFGAVLDSHGPDERQSMAGEIILLQQKIGEKVFDGTKAIKFSLPERGTVHVILADVRGVGVAGTDCWDYHQAVYGADNVPAPYIHWWGQQQDRKPVVGLLQPGNQRQRAARILQERIHFIGFCWDEQYRSGSLASNSVYFPNYHLLTTDDARAVIRKAYPLVPGPACELEGAV